MKPRKGENGYQFARRKQEQEKRLQKKHGRLGTRGQADAVGQCDAKTKTGGKCKRPRGFGTNHYGTGKCSFHGGNLPSHRKKGANDSLNQLMGREIQINPLDAILWCIRLKAGEVKWLTMKMAEMDKDQEWFEWTEYQGKQFNVWVRQRDAAMRDLTRFSKDAISLGLAERAVRLAEHYGDMIAKLINGILGDLSLTPDQLQYAPQIVRRHLIAIEAGPEDELAALTEGESKHPVVEGTAKRAA